MISFLKKRGAAMLIFVLFFAFTSSVMVFTLSQNIYMDLSDLNQISRSKQAYMAAESAVEDVTYRRVFGTFSVDNTESVTVGGVTGQAVTVYNSASDEYTITGQATKDTVLRKSVVTMSITGGSAFNYGLQTGTGGIIMSNNSHIYGNVYSNGIVTGAGSATVHGDIVSAGATGQINTITATGTVYANTINRVTVGKDAYYNTQVGTNAQNPVTGTRYTPAANQPLATLPLSTTTIQEWKDAITTYGTTILATDPACSSGTYTIDTSITIGYLKVECDVDIKKLGTTVTVNGPIWVKGNLSFTQSPIINVDPLLGRRSVQFIVDNPTNRLTSSKIEVRNSTQFNGSGDYRSYIMLLSMNNSSSLGGTVKAIDVSQSANGSVLVYAADGLVDIANGINLREVTGHKINVANSSAVYYKSGLASLLFTSGPGGGYTIDDWRQLK